MLTKNVGRARATDLLMGGRRFTGADAAKWGMITAAAPKEELEDLVKKYIKKYSQGPAVAYGTDQENDQQLHYERIKCLHAGRSRSSVHLQQDRRLQDRC